MTLLEIPKVDGGSGGGGALEAVARFSELRTGALQFAEDLSDTWRAEDNRIALASGLGLAMRGLATLLGTNANGQLSVEIPDGMTGSSRRFDPLITDFGQGRTETGAHRLQIPTNQIRTVTALAGGHLDSHRYRPVLDLNIRTSADKPISVFNREAGGIVEQPSPGQWYRFPLELAGMQLEAVVAE
jgi:hypothetical protein